MTTPDSPSDADVVAALRTAAHHRISTAVAHGTLTPIGAAEHRAFADESRSVDALTRLIAGIRLPEGAVVALTPVPSQETVAWIDGAELPPEPTRQEIVAMLGSEERSGAWIVPDELDLQVTMGSIELDLRDAIVAGGVLDVDYAVSFGSLEIIVPPGVQVWADNDTHFGSFEHKRARNAEPTGDGFLLRLRGTNWFGTVEVKEKALPSGESVWRRMSRWLGRGSG